MLIGRSRGRPSQACCRRSSSNLNPPLSHGQALSLLRQRLSFAGTGERSEERLSGLLRSPLPDRMATMALRGVGRRDCRWDLAARVPHLCMQYVALSGTYPASVGALGACSVVMAWMAFDQRSGGQGDLPCCAADRRCQETRGQRQQPGAQGSVARKSGQIRV